MRGSLEGSRGDRVLVYDDTITEPPIHHLGGLHSTVRSTPLSTPLGELDCLRYDVGPRTFWFDRNRPGMPVRYGAGESWWQMIGDAQA
ncbi:hypothetical protein [Actinotalea sp.]|uniref:hypothetical protein n=1 Tax=Actinotalea sp. TaxID=1872145 RepID=UPI003567582C